MASIAPPSSRIRYTGHRQRWHQLENLKWICAFDFEPGEVEGSGLHGEELDPTPKALVLRGPREPTKAEWEAHLASNHIPYRIWCRSCVAGRGKPQQHRSKDEEQSDRALPTISWDYAYMADKDSPLKASDFTMIVGRDHLSRRVFGHAVPVKGASNKWLVNSVALDLTLAGY